MAAVHDIPTSEQDEARARRIERLVELSEDGYDAYEDVDWTVPVDPEDERLGLFSFDPLAATDWYRRLPEARQAEVGLARAASNLRTGWEFECLLQQGLLRHAYEMDNTNASFRYLHTEVMEESQHTLMFHEFIRRHAPHVKGITGWERTVADPLVYAVARSTPALFYFLVLGGELPIDHIQRLALKDRIHPLLERLMEIHVEEEARHVAFANDEVRRLVPSMSLPERTALSLATAPLLGIMVRMMVRPSKWFVDHYDIPRRDLARAYRSDESRQLHLDAARRIVKLADGVGMLTPVTRPAWRAAGLV